MTRVIKAEHALSFLIHSSWNDPVNTMTELEESPTRYMLPEQDEHSPAKKTKKEKTKGEGYVDYSLNDLSPARYPTFNQKSKNPKKKKKKKDKKAKKEPGKFVQFRPTVHLICSKKTTRRNRFDQRRGLPFESHRFCFETKRSKRTLEISTSVPISHTETSFHTKAYTRYFAKRKW